MSSAEEYQQRQGRASSLLDKISRSYYEGSAQWFRPPFICYYDSRDNPVLLIHREKKGKPRKYRIEDNSTRRAIDTLVRERRIRKEREDDLNLEGTIPI